MSKRSQTELAVLGVLSIEPMSGYAVRRTITESMGLFWSESFGQIYPTLARLLEDGLIAPAAHGRTSGSSYAITEVGRRRLRQLLTQPVPSTPPRNGRLLRLFFGALVGAQTCAEVVEEARTSAADALARLAQERADLEQESDPGAPYRRLVLSAGEHAARAQRAWAEESLAELRRLAEAEP
jgi:DNA-binding PadR family transcriptional regulator